MKISLKASSLSSRTSSREAGGLSLQRNQLNENIHTLQAYMHFNRPIHQVIKNWDQPSTIFAQFTVENNYLNFHSFMRSNDIIYGVPYNIAYLQILQKRMLEYLNGNGHCLKFGYLHYNAVSLNLYDIDIAKKIVEN